MGRSDLIAGIAAVVLLVVVAFPLQLPLLVALGVAVVTYLAVRLAVPAPKEFAPGLTMADVRRNLREGSVRVARIRALAGNIQDGQVRNRVLRISSAAGDIYADFKEDPKDIAQLPDFGQDYLDPLIRVLEQYVRLSARHGEQDNPTIKKIEQELLPTVETNFSGFYRQLAQDDVVNLDAASEGLKSMLELGEPPA